VKKTEGKRQLGRPTRRWIVLKWILKEQEMVTWTVVISMTGCCDDGNESLVLPKCFEFVY
jgi:hypothetical protein